MTLKVTEEMEFLSKLWFLSYTGVVFRRRRYFQCTTFVSKSNVYDMYCLSTWSETFAKEYFSHLIGN